MKGNKLEGFISGFSGVHAGESWRDQLERQIVGLQSVCCVVFLCFQGYPSAWEFWELDFEGVSKRLDS